MQPYKYIFSLPHDCSGQFSLLEEGGRASIWGLTKQTNVLQAWEEVAMGGYAEAYRIISGSEIMDRGWVLTVFGATRTSLLEENKENTQFFM